jgi:hypothetical protein
LQLLDVGVRRVTLNGGLQQLGSAFDVTDRAQTF